MPEQYDNTDRGALFKNDKKTKPTQPDYTGRINVKGVDQRVSGWIETSQKGLKYLSLRCEDPLPPQELRQADGPALPKDDQPLDDDIPF